MSGKSHTGYPEKHQFDQLNTKILDGLYHEELHRLNKMPDKIKLVHLEGYVVLRAKSPTLLATYKDKLNKMVSSVVDQCSDVSLTVTDNKECLKIIRYMDAKITEKKFNGDLVYTSGSAGNAKSFRFYSKDREKAIEVRDYIERTLLQRNTDLSRPLTDKANVDESGNSRPSTQNKSASTRPKSSTKSKSSSVQVRQSSVDSDMHAAVKPKAKSVMTPNKGSVGETLYSLPPQKVVRAVSFEKVSSRDKSGLESEKRHSDYVSLGAGASNTHEFHLDANAQGGSSGQSAAHSQQTYNKSVIVNGLTVRFILIPLTKIPVDAIVNAANKTLSNGAGVALAIAKEAGKQYQRECDDLVKKHGEIAVSENAVTNSHKLKTCKHVINAVGPGWADYTDKEDALKDLALTVENVLETAVTMNMTSVAMPPISSGIFGFPKEACAWMYSKGVLDFTWKGSHGQLQDFIFVDVQDSTILDMTFQCLSKISNNCATIQIKDILKSLPKEQPLRGAEGGTARADKSKRKSVKAASNTTDRLCSHTTENGVDIFNFRNSLVVVVYTADIIRLPNVDILVTPESRSFKGDGILARKIAETAGNDYTKERRKYEGQPRQSGEILITGAGNLKFQKIFHVIMSRFDDRGPPSDTQLNQFKTLIKDVIQRANDLNVKKAKLKSIAMPLLGTGHIRDQWLLTAIGGAVFDGIYRYSKSAKTSVKKIHLVNINEETTSAIRKIFLSEATGQLNQEDEERVTEMEERRRPHVDNPKEALAPLDVWKTNTKDKAAVDLESCIIEKGNLAIIDDDDESDNSCVVCMEPMDQPVALRNCGHQFCRDCILDYFSRKPSCPMCNTMYGKLYGDQPVDATANVYLDKSSLPGHEGHGTFIIDYDIPDGRQNDQHPNPGMSYRGFRRRAYLPDTEEGQTVLHLLREAFNQGLIFTIGYSRTTGKDNVLTWNDIHHKTRKEGGPQRFGYPDPEYIPRVKEELAAKGIR